MNDTKKIEAKLDKIANSIDNLTKELEKHRNSNQVVNVRASEEKLEEFLDKYMQEDESATAIDGKSVVKCGQDDAPDSLRYAAFISEL